MKLYMGVGAVLFGWAFGAAADALGAGMVLSFFVSGVGSILGIVAGWNIARRFN